MLKKRYMNIRPENSGESSKSKKRNHVYLKHLKRIMKVCSRSLKKEEGS